MKNGEAIIPPTVIDQVWDTKEHLISVNYVVFKKKKKTPVICLVGRLHIPHLGEIRFLSHFLVDTVIHSVSWSEKGFLRGRGRSSFLPSRI